MIKVAINGYGTIGKRVADAVAAQPDMEVIGVSKTSVSSEAYIAKERGYPLYIADLSKKSAFEKAGIEVAGDVDAMLKAADIVVDATPGGVGEKNRPIYERLGKKAIFQGGEEHEVAGFSFNAHANYKEDHYEFLHLLNPQHIIPSHGDINMTGGYAKFAEEIGYTLGNDLHILRNGQNILIK